MDTVKRNTAWGIASESTEGTYAAPGSSTAFVQTLAEGAEINPSKELLERNVFNNSIGKTSPRVGMFQVTGSMPVEAKAAALAGGAPEYDLLLKSALGNRRQITTTTTTKASGNTATVLQIEDADISKFTVGDIIMTKAAGAFHVSPIISIVTTLGSASLSLLVGHPSGDHPDSVVIEKASTYICSDSAHPPLSISKYIEDAVLEAGLGCRVNSMALEGFSTGQLPSFNFGFEGLNFTRSLTSIPYTPSYSAALPPIILSAGAYLDGAAIEINELGFTLENTLAFKTSIAASNGRIKGRATERAISGSFNPYKQDDSIANYTKFLNNTHFSLFAYAMVPTGVAGEFGQVVACYLPKCIITELGETDQDGLLQEAITFTAARGSDGATDEVFLGFI